MLSGTVPILDSKFSPRFFSDDEAFFTDSTAKIVELLNRIADKPEMLESKVKYAIERAKRQTPAIVARQYIEAFTGLKSLKQTIAQ